MFDRINQYLNKEVSIAPLITLRVLFGGVMLFSLIRFISNGWVESLYLDLDFYFTFFDFIQYLGDFYIYLIFYSLIILSVFIIIGLKYKLSISLFFILFTYIELLEKSYYLNHYYFVSVLSFALIFLPLGNDFSFDSLIKRKHQKTIQNWQLLIPKILISIVYFYAGIAKLNSDWLIEAMPLKLWLPASSDVFLIGGLLKETWVAYLFSWLGAIYDLIIWIFLFNKKTRKYAYQVVIVFHLMTSILFQIGIFPYMMTLLTLIFFSPVKHEKVIDYFKSKIKILNDSKAEIISFNSNILKIFLLVFILFQLLFPFRYVLNKGDLFWTEEGYRFSWRVMLMEKTGWINFKLIDRKNNVEKIVDPSYELSDIQVKQMSFQPDMILQYAKFIGDRYYKEFGTKPEIYVDSYVSLNGSGSKRYFKNDVDIYGVKYSNISDYLVGKD